MWGHLNVLAIKRWKQINKMKCNDRFTLKQTCHLQKVSHLTQLANCHHPSRCFAIALLPSERESYVPRSPHRWAMYADSDLEARAPRGHLHPYNMLIEWCALCIWWRGKTTSGGGRPQVEGEDPRVSCCLSSLICIQCLLVPKEAWICLQRTKW